MNPNDLILFWLAMLVAGLIGYLAVDRLFPAGYPLWLVLAFSPATGLAICSIIVFLFRRPMASVEGIVLVALLALRFRAYLLGRASFRGGISLQTSLLALIFAAALGWTISASATRVQINPHGASDGWSIWDSHARYMLAGGPTWKTDIQNTFLPDYPLLLPGALVHTWRFMGNDSPDAAGWLGMVFLLSGLAILVATLIKLRSPTVAMLTGFVMLGTPGYVLHATSQFADVPLSVYVLASVALICLQVQEPSGSGGLMALAGFMAGCAAWTKNEGLPFAAGTAAALFFLMLWQRGVAIRRFLVFAAGIALPLTAIIIFKLTVVPQNYMFQSRNAADFIAKIKDIDRYFTILLYFFKTTVTFGRWAFSPFVPVLVLVVLSGLERKVLRSLHWLTGAVAIAILLISYFAIYVITPIDLWVHLDSSMDRLLMHIWPAVLLLVGAIVRIKEEGSLPASTNS